MRDRRSNVCPSGHPHCPGYRRSRCARDGPQRQQDERHERRLGVMLFLPLGGGTALPMVPAAVAGLAAIVWLPRAGGQSRRVALAASLLTVALAGVYFVGWQEAAWYPDNPGVWPTLRPTVKVLALAWGPAAEYSFPAAVAGTAAVLGSAVVTPPKFPAAAHRNSPVGLRVRRVVL